MFLEKSLKSDCNFLYEPLSMRHKGSFCRHWCTYYIIKETIQPNNKAPWRTLLFGFFVMTVQIPAQRPHISLSHRCSLGFDTRSFPENRLHGKLSTHNISAIFHCYPQLVCMCIKWVSLWNLFVLSMRMTLFTVQSLLEFSLCQNWSSKPGLPPWTFR